MAAGACPAVGGEGLAYGGTRAGGALAAGAWPKAVDGTGLAGGGMRAGRAVLCRLARLEEKKLKI